jgi:hypothetical protein
MVMLVARLLMQCSLVTLAVYLLLASQEAVKDNMLCGMQ